MYFFTGRETGGLWWRSWKVCFSLGPFLLADDSLLPVSLPGHLFVHVCLPCVQISSRKDTSLTGLGPNLKPVNPKGNQSLEGLMLKLKLQYFSHMMQRTDSLEFQHSSAGRYWRQEEKGMIGDEMVGWHHQLNGHAFEQVLGVLLKGKPGVLQSMGLQRVRHDWATELKFSS